jgi:uncharacterized protein
MEANVMMLRSLMLGGVLACSVLQPLAAQQPEHAINVVGYGELQVEPDIATFDFAIQGQSDSPANARARADSISGELVRSLEKVGVETRDIRSTPVTLSPFVDRQTNRELVRFDRTTTVIVRDLADFDTVQNAAFEAGVNAMGGVQFGLSNEEELQARARDLALADAQAQAAAIAATMGVELGRVLSVTVTRQRGFAPLYRREAFAAADAAAPEHRAGTVSITQDASVSFEIIQQPFVPQR